MVRAVSPASDIHARLEVWIARVLDDPAVQAVSASSGAAASTDARAASLIETYANEARWGLQLLAPQLMPGQRILEVGCGLGILARFLEAEGFDVVGIEPGASGFGFMPEVARAVLCVAPQRQAPWLELGAEQLDARAHGTFDLICSFNVLEHVSDLEGAFRGMAGVLSAGGQMLHSCPNYAVPYEPHFSIPLVPGRPRLTRFLFPRRVKDLPGVWDELNFISAQRVKRLALANGLSVTFERGVLGQVLRRLDGDPVFRARHAGPVRAALGVLRAAGLAGALDRLPPALVTPMVFHLHHAAAPAR